MIIFKDSKENIITKVEEGTAIEYHNRLLINPGMFIKEGESVMLLTEENLAEYQAYYEDMIDRAVETAKDCLELVKEKNVMIEKLIEENSQLKKLNKELTNKLTD